MVTIRKYLSKKQQKDSKKSEILLRISSSRKNVYRIGSDLFCAAKLWDEKNEKVTIPRTHTKLQNEQLELQKKLDALSSFLIDEIINVGDAKKITKGWLEHLVHIFHFGEDEYEDADEEAEEWEDFEESDDFFDLLETFINVRVKTTNRRNQFYCMARMLKRFEMYSGRGFKLTLDGLTDLDLTRFEEFLRIEHTFFDENGKCVKYKNIYKEMPEIRIPKPRGTNGIHYIIKRLRTFYNWAVKTGRTTNNPFRRYQLPACVYGTPYFITTEERNRLFEFDFSDSPKLAVQRDIFVFQSCIGIRTGDLYKLTWNNVVGDSIEYIANKTLNENANTVSVPLIPQAKTILKRHRDKNRTELLPFISTQKYNLAIKEMLKRAGINRIVTIINPVTRQSEQHPIYEVASSYMARRNFIGNLYKEVKDANLIGSMTGHTEGSRAFARYRAIDTDMKKDVLRKLE